MNIVQSVFKSHSSPVNRYGSRSFNDEYAMAIMLAVHKMIVMATRGVVSAPIGLSAPSCWPTRMLTAIERPRGTYESI